MNAANIAGALQRARSVLSRRPEAAQHADEPATGRWEQGLRVICRHPGGAQVATDMPRELGGGAAEVTPGWYLRAALASCLATRIAMEAADRGIALARLEVVASSRSDVRGLLGMSDAGGAPVPPEPHDLELQVSIAAVEADAAGLRELVEASQRASPVSAALRGPVRLRIEAARS